MTEYTPKPIETASITLPKELEELTEKLAENAHDHWAAGRMKAGWSYGPTRDDGKKLHPDLVPYDELEESEKDYDRNSAVETLKAVLALGYEIVKKD
ncbi:MAG: hypothetical protein IJK97_07655 [Thermoguttaceae bacterium]|nr:hypothetical protein [Thermoguttaceae bacterium]